MIRNNITDLVLDIVKSILVHLYSSYWLAAQNTYLDLASKVLHAQAFPTFDQTPESKIENVKNGELKIIFVFLVQGCSTIYCEFVTPNLHFFFLQK